MPELHACPKCLRRPWLIALLAPYIEKMMSANPDTSPSGLLRLGDEDLAELVAPKTAHRILRRVEGISASRFSAELVAADCWSTCLHDDHYPEGLRYAIPAPSALIGRGDLATLTNSPPSEMTAVVGAGRATSYGREVSRMLGHDLTKAGITVISGLGLGVDGCAHRGALDAGGTIAVLPTGADVAYPAAHRSLWQRICEKGVVISELPPGSRAWRWTFAARDRILAALAGITIVVEAAEGSPPMRTALIATALDRKVGAVPGPVTADLAAGPNRLIAEEEGLLIRGAADVLRALEVERPNSDGPDRAEPPRRDR